MTSRVTATQAGARLYALLDEVEGGEQVEITRRGRTVARLIPVRGPQALKDILAGVVWSNASDEELFSTGVEWDLAR